MADPSPERDARDYLRMVWRRRRAIALVVVAAVAASIAASLLSPSTYEATTTMVLRDQPSDPFTQTSTVQLTPDRAVQTEIEVFRSPPVRDRVRLLIAAAPDVAVASLGQSNAFSVTARAAEPAQAADIANAYARSYIDTTKDQAVADLTAASEQIRAKVADIQNQITVLNAAGDQPTAVAQRDALVTQQATYQTKLDQLQVTSGLQTGRAVVISPASPPSTPVEPRPIRSAVLALVLGAILGLGAALLIEYLDDTVKSKEEVEAALGGASVLGVIPAMAAPKDGGHPGIVTLEATSSGPAEAYRSLRTAVQFLATDRDRSIVAITSPRLGDGKTTTAVNLAVSLAAAGQRVAITCCDLRRPRLHMFFDLDNSVGLTSVITGEVSLSDALQPVPDVDGLELLASGPLPPNPAEVLATRRTREVLDALRSRFDTVVLDCPPILPVTDAAVLAPTADLVLVVVRAGVTRTDDVKRAHESLRQVHAPPAGGVLNGVTKDLGGYGYDYGYGSRAHGAARART